jgi:vitamin B12 transporter
MQTAGIAVAAVVCLLPLSWSLAAPLPTALEPIIVTAGRVAQNANQALASVTVIDRRQIEQSQALSLPDLLRGVVGLEMARSGGFGQPSSVFLRGTESDHVLVLIDGIKVGSATLGSTTFEHLSVAQIERIEIVRGPRSSLYGSEAIGGVIQIFTRRGGGALRPALNFGAGSFGTYQASAALAGGGERAAFNASVSALDSQGINACNGEPWVGGCFTQEPDRDGYRQVSGSARAAYRFSNDAEVDLHWLRAQSDAEFDGDYQNQSETLQQVFGLDVDWSPNERWALSLTGGRAWDESDNFKDQAFSSRFSSERDSLSWQNDLSLAAGHVLTLGLDYQQDRVGGSERYTVSSRRNNGLFGQYLAGIGRHDTQLSLRRDDNQQFGQHTTGSLAWGYEFAHGPQLRAAYGTAFKAPTFNELYFPGFGNPELNPETSASLELGLTSTAAWGHWSVNAYQTRIDDLIAFDANSYAPANIEAARIRGIEVALDTRLGGWKISTNVNLLEALNQGDGANRGKRLPRRAAQSANIDLARAWGAMHVGATLHGRGQRYDDFANTRRLAAYATLDLRAEYRLDSAWRLQARLENLFDTDYETAAYYNQPGRNLFITLRYQPH